ncbi:NAD(P)/FAD-dependent oxidoreductase [Amycolatopsis magusensis]|uniref:NADPH-dependent 2,4-dienoyl-CoA reductase/sulfur reductase-like enzyme n=1 Tax=Amycolatopsis magusensis TaxID=882444 RepID=A0ABS4PN93_9PSEU|nr:FAD/NAD(P)-binding oxidoreductase [Amycolatopsis magusensis]MBP2180891.1 NADPH-dependent 2,4-dienoyl-CoA reductase/sulfur reductase-like enzyme [Amycolatopsis magusensis]MDI5975961.1 FAD/NAD(P)-binding oxidoreductase [Amycolatopsis magusensis]
MRARQSAERIVIAGAGLAGLRAAERLRELRFDGEIVLIGSEPLRPYHRPALSKGFLSGAMSPGDLRLQQYQELGAVWRLDTTALHLQPRRRVVHLPGGEQMSYDGLIIATGVEPKRAANIPHGHPRVVVMRTLSDAQRLQKNLAGTRGPVAVIGGGFTGCEIASSLREMDREVTIIGRSKNLMGNVLGEDLGERLTQLHRDHGVRLALGASIQDWLPGHTGMGIRLSDGQMLVASCVVAAVGTVPAVSWLRGAGLRISDGVVCESTCHVIGADDVVAAGDVAQWPNLRFDAVPRRVEHWLNAIEMGRAAAENLLAGPAAAKPFTPMPRFWSEQHGVRIQAAGVPKLGTDTVALSPPAGGGRTVTGYVRDGRLLGVVGMNSPSAVLAWAADLDRQCPVPGELEVPDRPVFSTGEMSRARILAGR